MMKKILSLTLALALALSVGSFPAFAQTDVEIGVYNPEQQLIYLKPNSAGTRYEIDTEKHPNGVTIYEGDRFVFTGSLNGYGDAENYNFVLSSKNYKWYKNAVDINSVVPNEPGNFVVEIHRYTDANGVVQNIGNFVTAFSCTVASREPIRCEDLSYIEFTTENTKIIGRTDPANPFKVYWVNSGVEFDFVGTTVGVEINCPDPQPYICVIDGVEKIFEFQGGTFTYILANDLDPNVKHTVKILRTREIWNNDPTFISAVTDKGTTITKTPDRDLKIEFIGDSLTAGNGLNNYTQDYAYITAKLLNADSHTFAVSSAYMYDYLRDDGKLNSTDKNTGVGFVAPFVYSGFDAVPQKGAYKLNEDFSFSFDVNTSGSNDPYVAVGEYDYSFVPDIVVINLGSNDSSFLTNTAATSTVEYNKKGFKQTYLNFLITLGELYPNTKIVCSYGFMSCYETIMDLIKEAVAEYNKIPGHAEAVVFKYSLKFDHASDTNLHPGINSHINAANELSTFIKNTFAIGTQTYTADNNGKVSLPQNPQKNNTFFKGWFKENGEAFDLNTTLSPNEQITLTPVYVAAEDLNSLVDSNGNENDYNPVPTDAKYTNGLYIQGAQVRTPLDEIGANILGLRFVTVVNEDVLATLKSESGITNVKYGTLVASSKTVGVLELQDGAKGVSTVYAAKIWQSASTLKANYQKFTACVVNIPESDLATTILVRPFISYTDANGTKRYLYGEQYKTASIFSVAKSAHDSGAETEAVKKYLYENIIAKTKGDNDLGLDF